MTPFTWGAGGDGPLSFTDSPAADTEDGWNLLGNPFGAWFDWDAVELDDVNAPVYVYDAGIANYRVHTQGVPSAGNLPGGIVGPFQGFWVQANAASPSVRATPAVANGGPLYRTGGPTVVGLRLRPADGSPLPAGVESQASLALGVAGAQDGLSPIDARALTPAAQSYVLVATEAAGPDGATALAIDARPEQTAEVTVEVQVGAMLDGAPAATPLVLDWPGLDLPDGWSARLLDRETGATTALADGGSYAFDLSASARGGEPRSVLELPALSPTAADGLVEGRFALVVTPGASSRARTRRRRRRSAKRCPTRRAVVRGSRSRCRRRSVCARWSTTRSAARWPCSPTARCRARSSCASTRRGWRPASTKSASRARASPRRGA